MMVVMGKVEDMKGDYNGYWMLMIITLDCLQAGLLKFEPLLCSLSLSIAAHIPR